MHYSKRVREYQLAIREILMKEWDPISVSGISEAHGEYDSYVAHICGQLIRRTSEHDLFRYLWDIETVDMGLSGNRRRTEKTVQLLTELRDTIEKDG